MGKEDKKKEQKVVIQHYIPRCVLANFSNANNQIYEGLVMGNKSYLANIENSMAERFTYEHSFIEVNLLEKYFGRIESYIGPALLNIIKVIESFDTSANNINEIKRLINKYMREFIIFYYRSGALLYEFGHDQKTSEDRVLLMFRKIISSEYIRRLNKTVTDSYSFCIIKSVDGNFLISDQFISTAALGIKNRFTTVSNRQIGFKKVILLIPISKYYYAVYYHGKTPVYIRENKINSLTPEQVNEINEVIVNNSYIKSAGNSKAILDLSLSKFEFRSPVTIMAGFKSGETTGAVLKKEIFFYKEDEEIMEFFESAKWFNYKGLSRNDPCGCGSGYKFKKCHSDKYLECKRIMDGIENKTDSRNYLVSPNSIVELPINEWAGYVKPEEKESNATN